MMEFFDRYALAHQPYKNGNWCYEDGLLYRGLECLHRATGEARWLDHIVRLVDAQIGAGASLAGYDPNDYNIDNVMSGRALLYLNKVTGDATYWAAAERLIDQLATHPRTQSGVYWHKLRYPWQVWLDGLYMGPPFQIGYGLRSGQDHLVADSLAQVSTALDMTYVPETGLYAHAVDEARKQIWAHSDTGHTEAHWARAIGWLAMGLVDIAELVGPARFAPLKGRTEALLSRIEQLRQPKGLWLQVMDQPDLAGNYQESSASAMCVYALLKGKNLGLWNGSVDGLVDQLVAQTITGDADKGWSMGNLCHVAGLGFYEGRYRDGTAAYYVSETLRDNDIKGVAPLMMAVATALSKADAPALDRV